MARSTEPLDRGRRATLIRLGLAATAAYCAPVLIRIGPARASSSGGSGSFSSAPRQRRAPRPEIVVAAPAAADVDRIAAGGYTLLSRDRLGIVDAELARFQLPANRTIEQARTEIIGLVPAALFDLNHVYRPGEFPCGPEGCAAFEKIGWSPAAVSCPTGTVVGMIDTGVNVGHAALQGVDVETVSILSEGRQPASQVHGTAIAILIAGRADARTPGLLDGVRLVAAEAFHRDPAGNDAADSFDVARAIDRMVGLGVTVVNLSFAGPQNALLQRVVDAARDKGVLLVAAAGNSGPASEPLYPAAFDGVVAVTAVGADNAIYRNAVAGPHIDFAAPGVSLWTAASVSGGRFRSGTSYATPFVSAALAVARARDPARPVDELVASLAESALDLGQAGRDATFGWGLVQSAGICLPGAEEAMLPAGG